MSDDATRYPLAWPAGWTRTKARRAAMFSKNPRRTTPTAPAYRDARRSDRRRRPRAPRPASSDASARGRSSSRATCGRISTARLPASRRRCSRIPASRCTSGCTTRRACSRATAGRVPRTTWRRSPATSKRSARRIGTASARSIKRSPAMRRCRLSAAAKAATGAPSSGLGPNELRLAECRRSAVSETVARPAPRSRRIHDAIVRLNLARDAARAYFKRDEDGRVTWIPVPAGTAAARRRRTYQCGCGCPACTAANTEYIARYRAAQRAGRPAARRAHRGARGDPRRRGPARGRLSARRHRARPRAPAGSRLAGAGDRPPRRRRHLADRLPLAPAAAARSIASKHDPPPAAPPPRVPPVPGVLSTKQARFVAEYLVDGNAQAAARRAGYHPKHAPALLRIPAIVAAVQTGQRAAAARRRPQARRGCCASSADVALSRVAHYFDPVTGDAKHPAELDADADAALAGFEVLIKNAEGRRRPDRHDPQVQAVGQGQGDRALHEALRDA